MGAKSFVILYTQQTKKKHKVWHDGTLKFTTNNKGLLYDDKGTKLDSVFIKDDVQIGDQLESDHYLITIEEVLSSSVERTNDHANLAPTLPRTKTGPSKQSLHMQGRINQKPIVGGNCSRQNRIGLKRQRSGGFIPPLLKVSMQVDNQKEIPSFISQRINDALKNKNQNSYPNPSMWSSVMTRPNVSSDIPASLHCENTKANQPETYSSKSWFPDNGCKNIGRKSPLPEYETLLNKESCFDYKERSTDLIAETRIQTRCERTENGIQNSTWHSGIHQHKGSVSHFAGLQATVPFRKDEKIPNTNERFRADCSEVISSCGKRENISEVNPLLTAKNKRTAGQVVALLKSSTNEIAKNIEQENKSVRKLPHLVDPLSSEGISRDLKDPKEHSNDKKQNSVEKYEGADFIDQEPFEPNRNIVQILGFSKERDNKVYSSQNTERDSDFLQNRSKASDETEVKNPCDISNESSLDVEISFDFDFDLKNHEAPNGIGQPSPDECIKKGKNMLSSIEGFKNTINTEELNEQRLFTDKNDESSTNKDISEQSLFVSTAMTSTLYSALDSSSDEVSLNNIDNESQNGQEMDLFCLESDYNLEDKNFNSKRNTFVKEQDPTSFDIGNRTDSKTFLEPESNMRNTFKRDLTFSKDVISSSPPNYIPINKNEANVPPAGDNSVIHTKITVDKNFKGGQNKRPFVFSTMEEPQSKRFRIEPGRWITDSAISRDDLYMIENKRDDIKENLSSKVSISAKGSENVELAREKLNYPKNVPIEKVLKNVSAEEVSENVLEETSKNASIEEVQENVIVEEIPEHALSEEVLVNVFDKNMRGYTFDIEVPKSIPDENLQQNIIVEGMPKENVYIEVPENGPVEEVLENVPFEKVPNKMLVQKVPEIKENVLVKEVSENASAEEVSQNASVEEVSQNASAEEVSQNASAEEVSQNAFGEEVSQNAFGEEVSQNAFGEEVSQNAFAEEVSQNAFGEEVSQNAFAEEVSQNAFGEEVSQNAFGEEVSQNAFGEEVSQNAFGEEVSQNAFGEEVSQNAFGEEVSQNAFGEEVSQNAFAEEVLENAFAEEVLENAFAEEVLENTHVEEMQEYTLVEEMPEDENVFVEEMPELKENAIEKMPENMLVKELLESALVEKMTESGLVEKMTVSAPVEKLPESALVEGLSESALVEGLPESALVEGLPERALVEGLPERALVEGLPERALVEGLPECALVEGLPERALVEGLPERALVEGLPERALVEGLPERALVEGMPERALVEGMQERALVEGMPERALVEGMLERSLVEGMPERSLVEGMPERSLVEGMPESALVEGMPESALVEEMPESALVEGMPESALVEEMPESALVEEMQESVFLELPESAFVGELTEDVFVEEVSELVQSQANCNKSGTSDYTVALNNNFRPTNKFSSKLTNMNISGFPQDSSHRSMSKFSFKSLSTNNSKEPNCNPAKDNIIKENKPQNDIGPQINEIENSCNLSKTLLDPVVHPNIEPNVDCWDSSSSDGFNFDLSFDFDDNIHQANNNKQTDPHQNVPSDNNLLIKNAESCFLDHQVKEKPITKVEEKFEIAKYCKTISADDSSIGSNRSLTKQPISSSSYDNASILDNLNPQLKEKNNHFDFRSHLIPTCRDETKTVSLSTRKDLNAETDIAVDTRLSSHKKTIHEFDQKESLSNKYCLKKDESIFSNHCEPHENSSSESQIKNIDFSRSRINSQGIEEVFESHILNIDNEKNIDHDTHTHIFYSSLDELKFSPDPFDQFESGLDKEPHAKETFPSIGSGTSKPFGLTNILDHSVKALETSSISWDKICSPGKTDTEEVIFSHASHSKEVGEELEGQILDQTHNSVSLSEKSEVYRIGQMYPLIADENISEARRRDFLQRKDVRPPQRFIQQRKPVRPPSEISEDFLPCPSKIKGNFDKSMPGMEPPKMSLLSRAADFNGYRMHGSVFSDIVKRTKASSNLKLNDLDFKWDSEFYQNSTGSFSPQEPTNPFSREKFRTGFNSRSSKRTEITPRMKNRDKDFYNVQNNATYYDVDQTVPNDNDIMCSQNNEIDIPIPSLSNNLASRQPSSPCLSPCGPPLKEFENCYPESTPNLQNISFQEIAEKCPSSPNKAFCNFNSGFKELEYMKELEESNFDYEHYKKSQCCFEESFYPRSKNSLTMLSFNEHSNAKQTKLPSLVSSDSSPNLNLSLDSIHWKPNDNLHAINNVITASNDELNKTIVENIDLDIPPKMSSNKNGTLEEFILVSDSEESEFSDSQLIPSSESLQYKMIERNQTKDLKNPLSSKRRTEPVKCKPFDDSVTHENYSLCYYSSKQSLGENRPSENMETNTDNDFSDDYSLTLSQVSMSLGKEEHMYNSINIEAKVSMNRNNDLKRVISNQIDSQRNERDWNFIQENQGIITDSLPKIGSMPFSDAGQDSTTLFLERELLPTSHSFYKNGTSLGDIREYDYLEEKKCSAQCTNSLFESSILRSQLEYPYDEPNKLRIQYEELNQSYHEPDLNILDEIHRGNQPIQFEPDISQNQNQPEDLNPKFPLLSPKIDNSMNLVTSVSDFSHPSSPHLNIASSSLSQFNHVAPPFRSPWLTQQSLKIQQSRCPAVTPTDSSLSELSNNQSEILSDLLYSLQNPKICKSQEKKAVVNSERSLQMNKVSKYEELKFPSRQDVIGNMVPKRRMVIPVTFQNLTEYKKILTSVLKEHLNIILFELSSNYHNAMAKVDLSSYQQSEHNPWTSNGYPQAIGSGNQCPNCNCGLPSKMIQVRKEGRNKGRFFYTCTAVQSHRCKFFQWEDQFDEQSPRMSSSSMTPLRSQLPKLCNGNSINIYHRRHHITFYCESIFVRQSPWERKSKKYQQYECENQKDRLYIRLSFKEPSGCYSKDDLWIISKNLNLEPSVTFIARSVFYGPNSSSELQIEPLAGYSPSNWNNDAVCHAILAGNVSTELSCLMNLQEHVTISSSPIISSLLHRKCLTTSWTKTMAGFKTPFQAHKSAKYSSHELANLAEKYITFWKLNTGQAKALNNVASMLDSCHSENPPIILIHGVFGSGKSFLLAIIVLYLLDVIEAHENMKSSADNMNDEKILISSTTNVAVDRILLYLLEFGCSEFIRVGSVKKIAKPILPLSVHASTADNHDLKELQEMMRDENLSKMEKQYVRKSIEMHKLGLNKKKLHAIKVVGVTCASCSFSCLEKMKFPIVLLDECSQMTEPTSLLPLARFGCKKLLLVGDPLQLDPTIQGSEADNKDGLEQSMFDRLLKMGHGSVLLRRQYRCHPAISHISNTLFYGRQLEDGIKDEDRPKLVPELPTLCFYDVSEGKEKCESTGSFYNTQEADFVISLILALLASGIEPLSIGVIALYKSQTYQISRKMLEAWQKADNKFLKGKSIKSIQVSTVDAFQGGERDVIILSCVRTSYTGFVNNNKRMNVALSRARNHLFIIGKSSNLCTDDTWSQVIHICQDSSNSFQSAKEAKIKLLDLCSRAQMVEAEEKKTINVETKT